MTDEPADDYDPLEAFLSGPPIDRDELGDPPLADREDPFLDRERIHIRKDADSKSAGRTQK